MCVDQSYAYETHRGELLSLAAKGSTDPVDSQLIHNELR